MWDFIPVGTDALICRVPPSTGLRVVYAGLCFGTQSLVSHVASNVRSTASDEAELGLYS